jgi:hypothetical protein
LATTCAESATNASSMAMMAWIRASLRKTADVRVTRWQEAGR